MSRLSRIEHKNAARFLKVTIAPHVQVHHIRHSDSPRLHQLCIEPIYVHNSWRYSRLSVHVKLSVMISGKEVLPKVIIAPIGTIPVLVFNKPMKRCTDQILVVNTHSS
jgi:hypothetical protein